MTINQEIRQMFRSRNISLSNFFRLVILMLVLSFSMSTACAPGCKFTQVKSGESGRLLDNYDELKCLRDGDLISLTYISGDKKTGVFVELERERMFVQFDSLGASAVKLSEVKRIVLQKAVPASKQTRLVLLTITGIIMLVLLTRLTSSNI